MTEQKTAGGLGFGALRDAIEELAERADIRERYAREWLDAEAAGVADRVRFEVLDASRGLPERFDVVTTFDVVHDAVDPAGMLRSIRGALGPDGIYVCLDTNCSDRLEENVGPVASLLYGFSVMLCTPLSLAHDGEGLGTLGLHEARLRACERGWLQHRAPDRHGQSLQQPL